MLETREGEYWIATGDGVFRFNPTGSPQTPSSPAPAMPRFVVYRLDAEPLGRVINALVEDHAGVIWCGAARGLYQLVETNGAMALERVAIPPVRPGKADN